MSTGAFDRGFRLLPELAEHLPERVGLARAVDDEVYFQTAFPDFGGVVIDLPAGFLVASGVDHHGEAAAGEAAKSCAEAIVAMLPRGVFS